MLRMGIGERFYTVPYGFEEGIFRMRKQGYTAMDYSEFVNTETELFRMDNYQFTKYLQYQSKACANEGIEIFQTHGPWRWPTQDVTETDRAERFEKMCRAIEGTAILGCENMILHPIFPFSVKDEGYEKENYELNLEFMSTFMIMMDVMILTGIHLQEQLIGKLFVMHLRKSHLRV